MAPDSFKGTATAAQVAAALSDGLVAQGHDVTVCPLADGGEGTLEVLGGANRTTSVTGPLGDVVEAGWRSMGRTAVIESAQACGLALVGGAEGNDAVSASTYGVGELISAAVDAGARQLVIGVGGSATTDGGLGALRAMAPLHRYRGILIEVACDVRIGFVEAARVFAPQKGATPSQVELLTRRLVRLVEVYREECDVDVGALEGAGAAGGLAGGLACAGAQMVPGFDLVADHVGLHDLVAGAELVVTGEGFLDEESFDGKVVGGVAGVAAEVGVPVVAVVGESFDGMDDRIATVSLTAVHGRDRAMTDVGGCLAAVAQLVLDAARCAR